jgi:hypothetical protein
VWCFKFFIGSMRRSSLTIPSDPKGLLLLRVLMHSLKALLSSINKCNQFLFSELSDSARVIFDRSSSKGSGGGYTGSFSACSKG